MIQRDEYQKVVSEMTKLKRVQKENEKLRHQYEMLEREKDHWKSREIKLTLVPIVKLIFCNIKIHFMCITCHHTCPRKLH